MINLRRKEVALVLRGFDCAPEVIEDFLGVQASEKGVRGNPVKPGVKSNLKRSFARFSLSLDPSIRLDEVIPTLLDGLGGLDRVRDVRKLVASEFCEIDISWPVKASEEQEGGFLPPSLISDLAGLKCSLSFSFI